MERRKFIKSCCLTAVGLPVMASTLMSCSGIYYAQASVEPKRLIVKKSELFQLKKDKKVARKFVLVKTDKMDFPICLYQKSEGQYIASLMRCTHRSCELNVGGGIYTCPCHGSEFSVEGKVLEGPATQNLETYPIKSDDENIYILLS